MSDTPRTDRLPTPKHGYVPVEFARLLEREINALRAGLKKIADHYPSTDGARKIAHEVLCYYSK